DTVEELMLVRGVAPQLLYSDGSAPPVGSNSMQNFSGTMFQDPQLARGIYDLLTVYSSQPNTAPDGSPRVNLNDRNALRNFLRKKLPSSRANAIMSTLGRVNPGDVFAFYVLGRLTQEEFDQVGDFLTGSTGNRRRYWWQHAADYLSTRPERSRLAAGSTDSRLAARWAGARQHNLGQRRNLPVIFGSSSILGLALSDRAITCAEVSWRGGNPIVQ